MHPKHTFFNLFFYDHQYLYQEVLHVPKAHIQHYQFGFAPNYQITKLWSAFFVKSGLFRVCFLFVFGHTFFQNSPLKGDYF